MHFLVNYYKLINPLTPNDPYRGRTAPLTSKRGILCIYSTNIDTEYFKHGIYCPFFPLQNVFCFIILFGSCIIHNLYTVCANIKKNSSGAKRLNLIVSISLCIYTKFFIKSTVFTQHILLANV